MSNRQFLIDDIEAMMPSHKIEFLSGVSDEGLYRLWQDLVNLTTIEAIKE